MKYFDNEYLNNARIAAAKRYGKPFPLEVKNVVKRIVPLTGIQRTAQLVAAYAITKHYAKDTLDRQMELVAMREIVREAEQEAVTVGSSQAEDHRLDDPRHGQAAEINARR